MNNLRKIDEVSIFCLCLQRDYHFTLKYCLLHLTIYILHVKGIYHNHFSQI